MVSERVAVWLPVLLILAGLAGLAWRMLRRDSRAGAQALEAEPGMLFGLLIFAACAMGAFLAYALLGVR